MRYLRLTNPELHSLPIKHIVLLMSQGKQLSIELRDTNDLSGVNLSWQLILFLTQTDKLKENGFQVAMLVRVIMVVPGWSCPFRSILIRHVGGQDKHDIIDVAVNLDNHLHATSITLNTTTYFLSKYSRIVCKLCIPQNK